MTFRRKWIKTSPQSANLIRLLSSQTRSAIKSMSTHIINSLIESLIRFIKKAPGHWKNSINSEARKTSSELKIDDTVHKLNSKHLSQCRATKRIPYTNDNTDYSIYSKNNIGKISKAILERACRYTKNALGINQWRNTADTIGGFTKMKKKSECFFIQFDICNFYPSITEKLLTVELNMVNNYCPINNQDINIIKQAPKPTLFHEVCLWTNWNNPDFCIATGAFDSA